MGRGGGGGGGYGVVKVGEGAQSSHAGGIVFYLVNWKNISEKTCGRFSSFFQRLANHSAEQ